MPGMLIELAACFPKAVAPAQRRLTQLPSPWVFRVPMLAALGYLVVLSLFGFSVAMSLLMAAGSLAELGMSQPPLTWVWWAVPAVTGTASLLALAGCAYSVDWSGRIGRGGSPLQRAREACLAAAMVEAGAPHDLQRQLASSFGELAPDLFTLDELKLIIDRSLAEAMHRHQRVLLWTRVGGTGLLALAAALMVGSLYYGLTMVSVVS